MPGETNATPDVSRVSDTVISQSQMRSGPTSNSSGGVKSEYQDLTAQNAALLAQMAALSLKVSDIRYHKATILLTPKIGHRS